MSTCETATERVDAFISDWYSEWSKFVDVYNDDPGGFDLELWARNEREISRRHFVQEWGDYDGSSQYESTIPKHSPLQEKIVESAIVENTATIRTRLDAVFFVRLYEYELRLVGDDWRIVRISNLGEERSVRFQDREGERGWEKPTLDAILPELPQGVEPNCERLFENGREVLLFDEHHHLRVKQVGTIEIKSGSLGVWDLGWSPKRFGPLSRLVVPGRYIVELASVGRKVVAARVIFSRESKVVSWRPAVTADAGGNMIGVDSGEVAIFDATSYLGLTEREIVEKDQEVDLISRDESGGRFIYLRTDRPMTPDCIVVQSGLGDGTYPCYWGLDKRGFANCLVVDFFVLADVLTERVEVLWESVEFENAIDHPALNSHGVQVSIDVDLSGALGFKVIGDRFRRVRLIDRLSNRVIADSQISSLQTTSGYDLYWTQAKLSDIRDARVEIEIMVGYRN